MREPAERVLAHDRVAVNRRNTRLFVGLLFVLLLPALCGVTVWVMPFLEVPLALYLERTGWLPFEGLSIKQVVLAMSVVTLLVVAAAGVGLTLAALWRYGGRIVLRVANARETPRDKAGETGRLLEGLSLAAGIPPPALALVDSPWPNAFSTGRDPAHATVGVTRGLLELLHPRELEGVIAHEIAHIANEDTRLTTMLAAVAATATWPIRLPWRLVTSRSWAFRILGGFMGLAAIQVLLFTAALFTSLMVLGPGGFWFSESDGLSAGDVQALYWWTMIGNVSPFYVFCVTPLVAFGLRGAVARQRELLADAEAVMITRDPEGLALALAKIGAVGGELKSVESIAHLFVVDPGSVRSAWFRRVFPNHPRLERRIELLGRMGSGLNTEAMASAMAAGAEWRSQLASRSQPVVAPASPASPAPSVDKGPALSGAPAETSPPPRKDNVPVYERPDGWSSVLAWLPKDADVWPNGQVNGNFLLVRTSQDQVGWVSRAAALSFQAGPAGVTPVGKESVE